MADIPPSSSPCSMYEQNSIQIQMERENFQQSSPPQLQCMWTGMSSMQKVKKPPTVTPKRFTKFFTPRNSLPTRRGRASKAGRQLRDITMNGANRRAKGLVNGNDFVTATEDEEDSSRPVKRRKQSLHLLSSPPQYSPLRHRQMADVSPLFDSDPPLSPTRSGSVSEAGTHPVWLERLQPFPHPIRRLREPGPSRRILERSFGGYTALSRGFHGVHHGADWRAETANFVTTPDDVHTFRRTALPFCTTACNTNSLVAMGDEEGSVHLIDSSPSAPFSQVHVQFRAHRNAVMDIAFCSDDYVLATASGDQTARVVDMQTQQTTCILTGHKSSVKQVRFHPNDDNMITTSARDGCVQLWDLRCGGKSAVQNFRASRGNRFDSEGTVEPEIRYGKGLEVGHGHRSARRRYEVENRDELSITSFQHLIDGREHMIVTSSEVDSSVKLWDLRNAGRRNPVPLSSTPVPAPHCHKRHYGINAMALSGDGARLYTICRDATVYAYSTNQLVLGHAPEMSRGPSRRRMLKEPMTGLGPLYGLKHPELRLASFYVKASLRPAKGAYGEMLAVGSTSQAPILFPTDERHLPRRERPSQEDVDGDVDGDEYEDEDEDTGLPLVAPPQFSSRLNSRTPASTLSSGLPIFEHGTALIRGHHNEVTSLSWTTEGNLISVSDDFSARCWREDARKAEELRNCGEAGGARWNSGWASVDATWDEEEDM